MARRKIRRRYGKMTIPLAPIMGLLPAFRNVPEDLMSGDYSKALQDLKTNFTGIGYDGKFDAGIFGQTYIPIVAGLLVHKFVGGKPLNFNATLAKAKVPYIRI